LPLKFLQEMDKNTLIGLFLIGAILFTFTLMKDEPAEEEADKTEQSEVPKVTPEVAVSSTIVADLATDSVLLLTAPADVLLDSDSQAKYLDSMHIEHKIQVAVAAKTSESSISGLKNKFGVFANAAAVIDTSYTTIENDKILVKLSNIGGRIVSVNMKEFESYADYKDSPEDISAMALFEEKTSAQFLTLVDVKNARKINTGSLGFVPQVNADIITAQNGTDATITYRLASNDPTKYIDYVYTLKEGKYEVDFEIRYFNINDVINVGKVEMTWQMQGLATEKLAYDERMIATTMYRHEGSKRTYLSERSTSEAEFEVPTDWIAFKHKFFSSAIIAGEAWESGSVSQVQMEDDKYTVNYMATVELPATQVVDMKFYFGPNDYDILVAYDNGMEDIINLGWGIFGWVNKWMIQPIFNMLNSTGLAMGLIIFLVTLFVKIIITPLTYKNYLSSARMKVLKPEIERINAKYTGKEQMMQRQQETQALYKSSGVNPMAGCLPMLIQMPILLAVFRFFPSSLELRHKAFLWADDLSSFDSIASWSGDIPFLTWAYGNHISLFTLLMAASTMVYTIMNSQNMSQPTQPGMPNMKVIMYIFPVFMIFFFNSFSAGLSYYYLCGNLFNIGIMWAIKRYMIDEDKIKMQIAKNKTKPVKKSKFAARLEEVQKQQAQKNKRK
jgi:YidC/Oxa1 family membrane protein insertase